MTDRKTDKSMERFIKRFNAAIKDTADYIIKLEDHRNMVEYESHVEGREWEDTLITWKIDDATQKLAIVLATMVQWVMEEDENKNKEEQ